MLSSSRDSISSFMIAFKDSQKWKAHCGLLGLLLISNPPVLILRILKKKVRNEKRDVEIGKKDILWGSGKLCYSVIADA